MTQHSLLWKRSALIGRADFGWLKTSPFVAVLILLPATGYAQDDPMCESAIRQGPGLYIKYADGNTAVPIVGKIPYKPDAKIYVVPWFGLRNVAPNKEAVWHVRSQTTADSKLKSDQAYVYRPATRTRCRSGQFVDQSLGQFFDEFTPDERFVSLDRYIDHHAKTEKEQRSDFGLTTYFHFEVSNIATGNCFRTDDLYSVGNLHDAYGFPDVPRPLGLIARNTSPIDPVYAVQSRKYSGLSSEFAYLSGPAPACFSFRAPVPTASTIKSELFTWYRDSVAQAQAQTWRPIKTDIVIHSVPRGDHVGATIYWQPQP